MMLDITNPPEARVNAVRLLRCQKTKKYFDGKGWTDKPAHAQRYPNELEAVRACAWHGLHDVELVLQVPGTGTVLFATRIR